MKLIRLSIPVILIVGMFLRVCCVLNLPLLSDEKELLQIAKNISLESEIPLNWLAKDAILGEHLMISVYGIKLGVALLGENPLGIRMFSSLLFGIFSLFLIYFLMLQTSGKGPAVISLFLLAFNQYHLTHSAISTQHAVRQLAVILILLLFFRILKEPNKRNFMYLGIASGIGYYTQAVFLLLPIIFYAYLLLDGRFKHLLRKKYLYFSAMVATVIILPDFYWNKLSNVWHYVFLPASYRNIKLSWTGLNFFLIEPLNFIKGTDWRLLISWEHPIIRWYCGLIIFVGAIYSLRYLKVKFIALQLLIFIAVTGVFSLFPNGEFWWANIAFIPGIILGSMMLSDLFKWRKIGKVLVIGFLLFISFKAFALQAEVKAPPYRNATFADYDLDLMKWHIKKGMIDAAIKDGQAALMTCPNLVMAYSLLGDCYLEKGKPNEAYYYWISALELEPYFLPVIKNLERLRPYKPDIIFLKHGVDNIISENFADALVDFNKLLSQKPDSALGNFYLGDSLYAMHFVSQAQERFQSAIRIKPNFVNAYIGMGKTLLKENRPQEAILAFNQAIMLNPDLSESYYWLAFAYQAKGLLKIAEQLYEKVLWMSPAYAKTYLRLSEIYYKEKKFRKAKMVRNLAEDISLSLSDYVFAACPDHYRCLYLPKRIAREIYF